MNDIQSNLFPISIDYLYEGMEVKDEIYNYNGKVVLLGKGSVIDSDRIEKLKRFNAGKNRIYVLPEIRKQLVNKKATRSEAEQRGYELTTGYTEVKLKAENMFTQMRYTNKADKRQAEEITDNIEQKLNTTNLVDIFNLINAPRPVEEYLQRHCINVAFLNGLMGRWLKMSKADIEDLVMAGLLHDTGKTMVPQEILNAPRKLTKDEFMEVQKHPIYSYNLLSEGKVFSNNVRFAARHHHEKVDGTGYPDKLRSDDISIFAKITSISDVYDAMASKRSYKDSCNPLEILTQFSNGEFNGFDKKMLKAFLQKMPAQFVGKTALMSNGEIGIIEYIMPNDIIHPIVRVGEVVRQAGEGFECVQIIVDDVKNFESELGEVKIPN